MNVRLESRALERLERAISRLPTQQRAAFLLAARDGIQYAEIARQLAVPPRKVEKLIARALASIDREMP